ncbi:MAG: hypothetical protein RIR00_1734 [Pseudomonadota bacterium]|jgi:DNA repair photolyase
MSDASDLPPTRPAPRGRGAAANVPHRYSRDQRAAVDDGWWQDDDTPALRTELLIDQAKSLLSRNDSPDLPFSLSLNPYRGCEHGCIYCYARPGHAYLGLSPGLDFESRIFHKPNAPELLRAELARPAYRCSPISLGGVTDLYQPVERQLGLSRRLLQVMLEARQPVIAVTKSALVCRDLDLWAELAGQGLGQINLSLTTLDPALARQLEPRASSPAARLRAIRELAAAGIPVGVFVAPVIPGLTDHELENILAAAAEAGARYAHSIPLRLPQEVAGLFTDWLQRQVPDRAARVLSLQRQLRGGQLNDPRFGERMRGSGPLGELLQQRFQLACRRLGLNPAPANLDCSRFRPPTPAAPSPQLSLF